MFFKESYHILYNSAKITQYNELSSISEYQLIMNYLRLKNSLRWKATQKNHGSILTGIISETWFRSSKKDVLECSDLFYTIFFYE